MRVELWIAPEGTTKPGSLSEPDLGRCGWTPIGSATYFWYLHPDEIASRQTVSRYHR